MPTFSGLSWVMATVDPSDAARARAERAFADIDHDDRTRRDLFRARGQLLKYGPTWFSGLVPLPLPSWLPTWVPAWFASGRPSKATGPLSSHARVRALDDFDRLLAAAEQPWPRRIDAIIAVSTWPEWPSVFTRASAQELSRRIVEEFARRTAQQVRHIRCARLIVSTMPLDLIDPLTGKPLEGAGCHL
jgi:hypothetical protein